MAAAALSLRKGDRFHIPHDASDPDSDLWTGVWVITDARRNKGSKPTIDARRLLESDGGVEETFYSNSVHQYMSAAAAAGPAAITHTAAAGDSPYLRGAVRAVR